jgi:hypothetical protein
LLFVEIIYETGNSGIACYDTEEEVQNALAAHNSRAELGQPGGPIGQPAERIKRALVYSKHPNDYNPDMSMSADVAESEIAELIKIAADQNEGVVPIDQLAVEVRGLTHPHVPRKTSIFDSSFKMQEDKELRLPFNTKGGK